MNFFKEITQFPQKPLDNDSSFVYNSRPQTMRPKVLALTDESLTSVRSLKTKQVDNEITNES